MKEDQIICPECGENQRQLALTCTACNASLLLQGRYKLLHVLGENIGITYLAQDAESNRQVIIKELSIKKIDKWKNEELFQRETAILKQLNHPQIPDYIDSFTLGSGKRRVHYLIQEYIPGANIAKEMENRRYTEKEVIELLLKVNSILGYLQDLRPVVIHRDIKPSNIIRTTDGNIALIDFGAVKDIFSQTYSGETVAGTFGYMAPEQFRGEAVPQSDYYALGVTALVLLSRIPAEKMAGNGMTLDWRSNVQLSLPVHEVLEALLAEDYRQRPGSSQELDRMLKEAIRELENPVPSTRITQPATLQKTEKILFSENIIEQRNMERKRRGKATRTGSGLLAGIFIFIIFILFAVLFQKSGSTSYKSKAAVESNDAYSWAEVCTECQAIPMGLKGLSFGMNKAEVIAALPEVAEAAEEILPEIVKSDLDSFSFFSDSLQPEGFQLTMKSSIGEYPADIILQFSVDNLLSYIEISLFPTKSKENHLLAEKSIVTQFYKKYGTPQTTRKESNPYGLNMSLDRYWKWESEQALLQVTSHYNDFGLSGLEESPIFAITAELIIQNSWYKHEILMEQYESELLSKIEAKKEAQRKEKELAEKQELESLKERMQSLDKEL